MPLPNSVFIENGAIDANGNPIPTGTANNPWITSPNNNEDCLAAGITATVAALTAYAWYEERKDAIAKQEEIENEIMQCFEDDEQQYCNVDHPQQIKAIQTAIDIPVPELECSPCITGLDFEFVHNPSCGGNSKCIEEYADSKIKSGISMAITADKQNAKKRHAQAIQNRNTHLIRATNLAFNDYSKAYQFFTNASSIQSGLAGMAAQGYGTALNEFSYSLGVLGSAKPSGN